MSTVKVVPHVLRVRALYKAILKLHRGLPLQMKALGDQYAKEEFRLHKNSTPDQAEVFMTEWSKYYLTMAKQIASKRPLKNYGQNMSPELLDCFNDEQISQMYELFMETKKPLAKEEES